MAKRQFVLLVVPKYGFQREFSVTHAERLLRMKNNGGWQLPDDSEYVFDLEYGLRYKSDRTNSGEATAQSDNS